jgi:hypothetical protein
MSVCTTKRRAKPSTASRRAEAAMPMMVDLKFKAQISKFKEEAGERRSTRSRRGAKDFRILVTHEIGVFIEN